MNSIITTTATESASAYAAIFSATPEARKEMLKQTTGTTTTGDLKKTAAKILAAMIAAGDCEVSKIKETAEAITGTDIREIFQGVYELRVVFSTLAAKEIDLVEDEFDSIGSSILGLLSPFIQKEELKPLLPEAVALAKNGTAAQIRALKPKGEPKEPKAVKAMREKAEAAEAKATEAEARVKAAEERADKMAEAFRVEIPFYCTDIAMGAPILTSTQVRNRIQSDVKGAIGKQDAEMITYHVEKLAAAYFGTCQLAGIDPLIAINSLVSQFAKPANKPAKKATATIEAVEIAA